MGCCNSSPSMEDPPPHRMFIKTMEEVIHK
ncbi:BnaC03g47430D [Brassica napus]|uniref:BnaC03g47430D protein n=1 Tax=Brassica napus TaxID=3708 RepID=A0A078F4A1_BRANA|nr:BnaC03g47430D [Brassica napus]